MSKNLSQAAYVGGVKVIDFRHLCMARDIASSMGGGQLIALPLITTEALGLGWEIIQKLGGDKKSAFRPDDLFSNLLGGIAGTVFPDIPIKRCDCP